MNSLVFGTSMDVPKYNLSLRVQLRLKRLIDIAGAVAILFFGAPFFIVLVLFIFWRFGLPVFFKQRRPGLNERIFEIIKFRTMTNEVDSEGRLLPDYQRMTPFGSWLREHSLDELPEVINVLKGEMSLVGPRPLLEEYLSRYNSIQKQRHLMRPGITGLAQCRGRNAISWEEKFEFDVWYVQHFSLWLDIRIVFQSVIQVIRPTGINASKNVTMPSFMGSSGLLNP